MSRLVADQESRGGAGDKESGMRMTLAEGCGAVNDAPWHAAREARAGWFLSFIWFVWFV